MRLPCIFKEAFTTNQLRTIKRFIPIERDSSRPAMFVLDRMSMAPIKINIPRGHKHPINTLVHEFGHLIDAASGRISNIGTGDTDILKEIMANREGARFLLHTGSPASEVKSFIRDLGPSLDTYKNVKNMSFLKETLKAMKEKLDMPTIDRIRNLPKPVSSLDPIAAREIREINAGIISKHNINPDVIMPYANARNAIDLSVVKNKAQQMRAVDRRGFATFVANNKIKHIKSTPRVIHLGYAE